MHLEGEERAFMQDGPESAFRRSTVNTRAVGDATSMHRETLYSRADAAPYINHQPASVAKRYAMYNEAYDLHEQIHAHYEDDRSVRNAEHHSEANRYFNAARAYPSADMTSRDYVYSEYEHSAPLQEAPHPHQHHVYHAATSPMTSHGYGYQARAEQWQFSMANRNFAPVSSDVLNDTSDAVQHKRGGWLPIFWRRS